MSLREQAAQEKGKPGLPCGVARMAADLAACTVPHPDRWDDEAAEWLDSANDPAVAVGGLSRAMTKRGHPVSAWVIGHHRRGDCRCP